MMKSCLVIGDLNIDLILAKLRNFPSLGSEVIAKNYLMDIGGSGGIFSSVLSQLGIKTYIISKVCSDIFGKFLLEKLRLYDVDVSHLILTDNNRNGLELSTGLTINLSFKDDKQQISSLNLLKNLSIEEIIFDDIKNIGHVHFTSYYMMNNLKSDYIKLIKHIKTKYPDATISFDTNDDPEDKWESNKVFKILRHVDIYFANKKEAMKVTNTTNIEKAVDKLNKEVGTVIIKLGREGCMSKLEKYCYIKKPPDSNFKDSTGAGDNFDAGFIYGYMNNFSFEKSLEIANICGAKSTEYLGGVGNKERFHKLRNMINRIN